MQFGFLWASEPIIVALLVVLVWTFAILRRTRPSGVVEAIVTDGTFGLYLGWVCVATAANTAAVLTAAGFRGFGLGQDVWGVLVAAVAGLVGVLLAVWGRGRLAPTVSLCWGLAWVAVGRLDGPLVSVPTAVTAVVAVVVVVLVTLVVRSRAGWAARRRRSRPPDGRSRSRSARATRLARAAMRLGGRGHETRPRAHETRDGPDTARARETRPRLHETRLAAAERASGRTPRRAAVRASAAGGTRLGRDKSRAQGDDLSARTRLTVCRGTRARPGAPARSARVSARRPPARARRRRPRS